MTLNNFSIKNFISDLPKMLNENFAAIKKRIDTFFTEDDTLTVKSAKVTGSTESNSVSAQTVTVKTKGLYWHDGSKFVGISELVDRIEKLERKVNELENK